MSGKIYTPAMLIENKPVEVGALGCFARRKTDPSVKVLLSNAHVLFGFQRNKRRIKIFQPPSKSTCCRNQHIATTLLSWDQGFHEAKVKLDAGGEIKTGYETDCAIASLETGIQFTNAIPKIGMIAGIPPAGDLGIVHAPGPGTPFSNQQYVRFYSPKSKSLHYGVVLKPKDSATYQKGGSGKVPSLLWPFPAREKGRDKKSDARPNINQIVVLPQPAPGESYERYLTGRSKLYFGKFDDSGSVVVNHQNQVIGLMVRAGGPKPTIDDIDGTWSEQAKEWRAASSIGILSPIHKVLDQLQIEIPANFSQTSPSAGVAYAFQPGVETDPEELALEESWRRVEKELAASRLGRFLLAKLEQHRKETRRIVIGVRQAMVAWHRHHGPAFVDHFVRHLRDPEHPIPTAINGVERGDLLRLMAEMLILHGSPKLRRDVEKHRDLLLAYQGRITRFDQVPLILAELENREPDERWTTGEDRAVGGSG